MKLMAKKIFNNGKFLSTHSGYFPFIDGKSAFKSTDVVDILVSFFKRRRFSDKNPKISFLVRQKRFKEIEVADVNSHQDKCQDLEYSKEPN